MTSLGKVRKGLPVKTTISSVEANDVMSMSVVDKWGWLRGIQLARESHSTAPPAHQQQQQLMHDFFQTTDN
jgi:hypothetical protein